MKNFYSFIVALMAPAVLMAVKPNHRDEESAPKACAAPLSSTSESKKAPFKAVPRKVVGRAPIFVRTNFFLDQPHEERNEIVQGAETNTNATHACVHLDAGEEGKAQIERLGQCTNLEALWVARNLAEHGVPLPAKPEAVQVLQLGDWQVNIRPNSGAGIQDLLTGERLVNVGCFTSVTSLCFDGIFFREGAHPFEALAQLSTLEQFRLSNSTPLEDAIAPDATFKALTVFFKNNPHLELVSLVRPLTEDGMPLTPSYHKLANALGVIKRLRSLGLGHMALDAEDLAALPLQHLEHLCLQGVKGLTTFAPLAEAPALSHLHVNALYKNCPVLRAEGLRSLAGVRRLKQLFLVGLPKTDDVAEALCALADRAPETVFLAPMGYFSEDACQRLTQVFGENCGPIDAAHAIPGELCTGHACALSYNRPPRNYQERLHPYFTDI